MRPFLLILGFLLAGCAGSVGKLSDMRDAAPDWYEARKTELAGEGYPSLANVPQNTTYRRQQASMVLTREEQNALLAAFEANPRSAQVDETLEQILEWSRALRARVDQQLTEASFLTDAQIARLHARFDRPRARR
ncbi:hypothetical protein WNY37_10755 [Henriciella sp. AS95]|uniref:hypothetical protein n=1 Tax=Henriciella sp. AS95 TaxID=3135782 RepID=UPI003174EC59